LLKVPGSVTQPVSFALNLFIKEGVKLVTNALGRHRRAADPVCGALVQLMQPETGQVNLLVAASLES
jgi:hypothetical protein